jgi:hypothetical protein
MLYSRRHNIAFAHYPKTAGSSVQRWFFDTFSDAVLLNEENPHLPVDESLRLMRPNRWQKRAVRLGRESLRIFSPQLAEQFRPFPESLRVIGVLRDPFDMLVSLFEYWKREPFEIEPADPFIQCARRGCFRDFVAAAVIGSRVPTYEQFFGVGGPLWANTHLLDFETLQPALDRLCVTLGIGNHRCLPALNRAPKGGHDTNRYRDEAGPLVAEVARYFRWYHDEGVHLLIRGDRQVRAAA